MTNLFLLWSTACTHTKCLNCACSVASDFGKQDSLLHRQDIKTSWTGWRPVWTMSDWLNNWSWAMCPRRSSYIKVVYEGLSACLPSPFSRLLPTGYGKSLLHFWSTILSGHSRVSSDSSDVACCGFNKFRKCVITMSTYIGDACASSGYQALLLSQNFRIERPGYEANSKYRKQDSPTVSQLCAILMQVNTIRGVSHGWEGQSAHLFSSFVSSDKVYGRLVLLTQQKAFR